MIIGWPRLWMRTNTNHGIELTGSDLAGNGGWFLLGHTRTLLLHNSLAGTSQSIVKLRDYDFQSWFKLWIVALLLNVFPGVLFAYAEVRVTSILAGIINAATPLATLIVILLLFRDEKPKNYQLLGLLFGAVGAAISQGRLKRRK